MSNTKPYDKLWAILSVDGNGNEGICAVNTPIGPQVAVTGEKRILDIYIEAIASGRKEAQINKLSIVVAEFIRSDSKIIIPCGGFF